VLLDLVLDAASTTPFSQFRSTFQRSDTSQIKIAMNTQGMEAPRSYCGLSGSDHLRHALPDPITYTYGNFHLDDDGRIFHYADIPRRWTEIEVTRKQEGCDRNKQPHSCCRTGNQDEPPR
jgi:hypothetical protein